MTRRREKTAASVDDVEPDEKSTKDPIERRPSPPMPRSEAPEPIRPRTLEILGQATPRGYGQRPKLSPEAAAAFATFVDSARVRAGIEGRTLIYTVRWS